MIIGLVGYRCAGKGEVSNILCGEGFGKLSFGDEVRLERDARGLSKNYDLHKLGVDLRKEFGPQYWGVRIAGRIQTGDYVIDGMRTLGDLDVLTNLPEFYLVGVHASLETRFRRSAAKVRGRLDDTSNFDDFVMRDTRDRSSDEGGLQSEALFRQARYVIANEDDLTSLRFATLEFLRQLRSLK